MQKMLTRNLQAELDPKPSISLILSIVETVRLTCKAAARLSGSPVQINKAPVPAFFPR